jgi:hypothetical protein
MEDCGESDYWDDTYYVDAIPKDTLQDILSALETHPAKAQELFQAAKKLALESLSADSLVGVFDQ